MYVVLEYTLYVNLRVFFLWKLFYLLSSGTGGGSRDIGWAANSPLQILNIEADY